MLSVYESTWDKELKQHTCCGSMHSYHKGNCPTKRRGKIPGRGSDPNLIRVQELKAKGYKSSQVAQKLQLALSEVNDLWVL